MKKLAIFVEGKTERVFVEKLLRQCVDEDKLNIVCMEFSGGSGRTPRITTVTFKTPQSDKHLFYVQIMESRTDNRVASDVRDKYDDLVKAGFSAIIAIRDVRPDNTLAQVPALRTISKYRMKTKPIDPLIVLAILEIEAWFLAEHTHYERIHANITCARVAAELGFDPIAGDMTVRLVPNEDLHAAYKLEGLAYRKKGTQIERTVEVLDYAYIYLEMIERFEDLKNLISTLDGFFEMPAATA